tara:strand:- start:108 stop:680 length:573 start_codon:yes stop_codon:yes gene_type:complete
MIIGISGKAGSGKDTVGDYLVKEGVIDVKIPLAKSLKELCSNIFNIPIENFYDKKDEDTHIKVSNWLYNNSQLDKERIGTNLTGRELLQYFGTDVVRSFHSSTWVDLFIEESKKYNIVTCTDVRFIDEVEAIQKSGGIVIRLTRNPSKMSHVSENQLDDYKNFDIVYNNEGETPIQTCEAIKCILTEGDY